ncbi:bifunctional 4-hydroxy-2-oxoglutarate aldolase/2-dehydro-3-deoxy-phosphogluconate aldolase [Mycobacterium sp. URHD0025]|uniref:bifunctional 4-hydroxy-2-oxoglutarate aldolase/2-dehydro-3-deoxy-phosphogluconate aldolase n=1 Tax=Mycobacterium sp. URHD0025 TaxID=1298864 RepID=UPI00042504CB|nr:bifunctional 4-hydroxy-2-oxoglutarate aldolase/2-dehydro-3-deoxy-phosphogluconate aldolase [Mycobacterium sp. URHD0025]
MSEVFEHRVIPLATVRDPDHVDAIGDGLVNGGLPVVEVALRGEYGLAAIRRLAARGDLLVGAGTVRSGAQARDAIEAGARFVVSPGLDPEVVRCVEQAGLAVIPGVLTPTEVETAARLGLRRVKLFPAAVIDASALLSAYAAVFPEMLFMPSAGVTAASMADFLTQQAVFAVSGSWIAARADAGADAVADAAREAVAVAAQVPR